MKSKIGVRICVPEGMLKAALDANWDAPIHVGRGALCGIVLEAALGWMAENPIVPDHAQAIALCEVFEDKGGSRKADYCDSIRSVAVEWQRRMFLAPEPEVPEALTAIAKRLEGASWIKADLYHALIDAYRLGQKEGK